MGVRWVATVKATASIVPVLTMLFNHSIQTGKLPSAWKVSNIIPIPKGSSSDEPHNYRPIEQHGTTHILGSDMTGKE